MKQFCIVIPVYKEELDCIENISLHSLAKCVNDKDYDIILVGPDNLDYTNYSNICRVTKYIGFDKSNFESIHAYSQLCINYDFYNTFADYEYMYLYQLDCYQFEDNISSFCNLGYDYIGAPVVSQNCGWDDTPRCGNGGLSLRKVETFMYLTDPNGEFMQTYPEIIGKLNDVDIEDKYFCIFIPKLYEINISPVKTGIRFSWDMNPDFMYDYMHAGFPMGAHAIGKNIRFYKEHIPEMNTPEVIEFCENKYKEFFKIYYTHKGKFPEHSTVED